MERVQLPEHHAITPVILCGGDGTRLWPLSRARAPKPFLPLIGEDTLFEKALGRVSGPTFSDSIIVTGSAHVELVERQIGAAAVREIVVEPEPRGTAAAAGLAAARVTPDSILLVCPSDHHIEDESAFLEAVQRAAALAADGWLVAIGVAAASAETRFGYLRRGKALGPAAFETEQFVEKPPAEVARDFVESGEFAWNSGIFAFRARNYLDHLGRYRPDFADTLARAIAGGRSGEGRFDPSRSIFCGLGVESIDKAVMENTDRAAVVMSDPGWSDVGDWLTLYNKRPKDSLGNSVRGPAELLDCRDVLVDSDGPRVHLLGVEGIIVVVEGGDVLVAKAGHSREVGKFGAARKR